jgi:5-methylcytosine-specific restriction protein A
MPSLRFPCRQPGCGALLDRPGWCVAHQRPRFGHLRPLPSDWDERHARVLRRDGNRCQLLRDGAVCGRRARQVDHKLARAFGGSDELDNLQAACDECHRLKSQAEAVEGARYYRAAG